MKLSESSNKKPLFIELRAVIGKSLDEIAKELEVSKTTLLKWDKEFRAELDEVIQMRLRVMLDEFGYGIEGRLERIIKLNERLLKEIETRDLTEIPTDKLIKLHLESFGKLDQMIVQSEQVIRDLDKQTGDSDKPMAIIRLAYADPALG
jgi:hypothetical protein